MNAVFLWYFGIWVGLWASRGFLRIDSRESPRFALRIAGPSKISKACVLLILMHATTLGLLNALNSEDRGLKVRFSLATIAFDRESAQMSRILSSQGKNAPSNPYPHYLVRLATSRYHNIRGRERERERERASESRPDGGGEAQCETHALHGLLDTVVAQMTS